LINQELTYDFEKRELKQDKLRALEALRQENQIELSEQKSRNYIVLSIVVSIGLIFLTVLIILISRQLRILKSQKLLIEKQNKEIEMKALRSQMNPHFLFNSLNSIKHFIVKNDSEIAAKYLTKFSKLIRLVLENSKYNLISLTRELEGLKYYLELEHIRFNGKFSFEITGLQDVDYAHVPPLILQPFVENCIWHGIMNKNDGEGLIIINVAETNIGIQIEIEDNGIGRDAAAKFSIARTTKSESMGLDITHRRLQTLNKIIGIESKIEVVDLVNSEGVGCGTRVILTLPYNEYTKSDHN